MPVIPSLSKSAYQGGSKGSYSAVNSLSRLMRAYARELDVMVFVRFLSICSGCWGIAGNCCEFFWLFRLLCAIYVGCFVYVLGVLGDVRVITQQHKRPIAPTSQNLHTGAYRLLQASAYTTPPLISANVIYAPLRASVGAYVQV